MSAPRAATLASSSSRSCMRCGASVLAIRWSLTSRCTATSRASGRSGQTNGFAGCEVCCGAWATGFATLPDAVCADGVNRMRLMAPRPVCGFCRSTPPPPPVETTAASGEAEGVGGGVVNSFVVKFRTPACRAAKTCQLDCENLPTDVLFPAGGISHIAGVEGVF